MAEFMMIMKADSVSDVKDWQSHIETRAGSGKFRGGSALGNGIRARKDAADEAEGCIVAGFLRFEADSMADVSASSPAIRLTKPAAKQKFLN